MQPSLANQTPEGRQAKVHAAWSVNMTRTRGSGISAERLASLTAEQLRRMGVMLSTAPSGHMNPEASRVPVGAGIDRVYWNLEAWFEPTRRIEGRDLNAAVSEAFKNSGGGSDWPVGDVVNAMAACETVREVTRRSQSTTQTAAEIFIPFVRTYRDLSMEIGTACATYETFTSDPVSNVASSSAFGRAVAEPVDASNNVNAIGTTPTLFNVGSVGITSAEIKIAAVVVGAVLVLGTAGYFLRSVKLVTL